MSLPTYRIEPPDTLQIEALKLVPRPPYRIEAYDVLQISVQGTMPNQPINNYYLVEGEGTVNLGPAYGTVRVTGMTIEEANEEITRKLQVTLQRPEVSVLLARSVGIQQITDTYQVQPDGTVSLHGYGAVARGRQDDKRGEAGDRATRHALLRCAPDFRGRCGLQQ